MKHRRGPAALGLALAMAVSGCDNGLDLPVLTITQTWSVEGDDTRSFSFQSDDDGKIAGSFTGQEDRGAESATLSGSWTSGTVTFTVNWTVPVEFRDAARHPEKVETVILLSPAYSRTRSSGPPAEVPAPGAAMTKQSKADFVALWDSQLGCEGQFEPSVRESVWVAMLESDPVGATWGTGVRRAPRVTTWGWNRDEVGRQRTPMLLISPETDGQVAPERVAELWPSSPRTSRTSRGWPRRSWRRRSWMLSRAPGGSR